LPLYCFVFFSVCDHFRGIAHLTDGLDHRDGDDLCAAEEAERNAEEAERHQTLVDVEGPQVDQSKRARHVQLDRKRDEGRCCGEVGRKLWIDFFCLGHSLHVFLNLIFVWHGSVADSISGTSEGTTLIGRRVAAWLIMTSIVMSSPTSRQNAEFWTLGWCCREPSCDFQDVCSVTQSQFHDECRVACDSKSERNVLVLGRFITLVNVQRQQLCTAGFATL